MSDPENVDDQKRKVRISLPASTVDTLRSLDKQSAEVVRRMTEPLGGLQHLAEQLERVKPAAVSQSMNVTAMLQEAEWLGSLEALQTEAERWGQLHRQFQQFAAQHQEFAETLDLSKRVFVRDLRQIEGLISNLAIDTSHPKLSERLLAPSAYFSRFACETLSDLRAATEGQGPRAQALSSSLLLAEDQVTSTRSLVSKLLQQPVGPDDVTGLPDYTLFERTQDDLLAAKDLSDEGDPDRLYEVSPSSRLGVAAREVIGRVVNCNRNAEMQEEKEVFPPTSAILEATSDLGFLGVAQSRKDLGAVVDALYKILYEGAGAGPDSEPRYMRRGYVADEECGVVWRVKYLRNYWLRHDPMHGAPTDQQRKRRKLREALEAYGMDRVPSRPREFARVHEGLIRDAREFLDQVERKIAGG